MDANTAAHHRSNPVLLAEARVVSLTYVMSFLSGAAALIYQVTWVKMISLSFGSTTLAAGAVIGSFMAGMGIGARFYDVVYRRYRHALKLYAALEFGIAVTTAAITLSLYSLPHLYARVCQTLGGSTWQLGIVRFVSVFLLLLLPSALMGATFPALCTALIRSTRGVGRHLGMIYGLNTLGAAAGAVAAGFVLIEALGNRASTWVANGGNLAIAAAALWLWTQVRRSEFNQPPPASEDTALTTPLPRILVGAVLIGSGFATMAYEVFWIRALKYVVGNSTYAVSMVLVIFLAGLGIGGVLFRKVIARRHLEHDLGFCQLGIAALALGAVGLEAVTLTQPWFARNVSVFSVQVMAYPWQARLLLVTCVALVLLLPPTICMGLSFPLASRLFIEDVRRLGSGIGTAYLLANIGSILGVVVAAALLLPALGTAGGTKLVAAVNVALGLGLLLFIGRWSRTRAMGTIGGFGVCVLLVLIIPARIPFRGEFEKEASRTLFWKEGDMGTVKVVELASGLKAMTIDGYAIGTGGQNYGVAYKQKLLAHFPMLLVPEARRTLNIGLGSGTTLATLAAYRTLELLDCVEIVPDVVEGASLFEEFAALDDPRVKIHVDDAVHFLLTTETTYDIIIADGKQNPTFSGNAAILSEEFQRYCLAKLSEDGVLIEWLAPAYPPRAFRAIVRSFCDVFPEAAAYYFYPAAIALVGSHHPVGNDAGTWPLWFEVEQARRDMAVFHIDTPLSLFATRVVDGARLRAAVGEGEANTWDHPILEFIHYKEFDLLRHSAHSYENLKLLHDAERPPAAAASTSPGLAERYRESGRCLRYGFLEVLKTQDAEVLRPACRDALRVNAQDWKARDALRTIPHGLRALLQPAGYEQQPEN